MLKKLINFLVYANLCEENYKLAEEKMAENNVMMLRVLSSISETIFILCTVLGLFVPNMHSKMIMYVSGLGISTLILLASFFSHSRKIHSLCMSVFNIMLLAVGLMITLIGAPEQLTITLIPVALLIPLFFDTQPYKFSIIVLLSDLVYLIFAPRIKPAEILTLDLVDVFAFSIAGILIGTVLTKVKVERYIYALEIEKIAMYDELTECYNRSAYNRYIEENKNIPENFSALMVDINGLKKINDNLGHKAGDELIITVARAIKSVFSEYGKCYRLGGDEFMIFLKAEESVLKTLIESLRKILIENKGELVKEITVSVGYASADKSQSIESLVHEADKKMYSDKAEFYSRTGNSRR